MIRYYVPYVGEAPAAVQINGHRLLILGQDQDMLAGRLDFFGADRVEEVIAGDSLDEQSTALDHLARQIKAGIVVSPPDAELDDILENLERELPWLQ